MIAFGGLSPYLIEEQRRNGTQICNTLYGAANPKLFSPLPGASREATHQSWLMAYYHLSS